MNLFKTLTISTFGLFTLSCLGPKNAQNKLQIIEGFSKTIEKKFSKAPQMTIQEFNKTKNKENYLLVDVRSNKERLISILPGAISKDEFEKNKGAYKDRKIIVYCTIGYRSSEYVEILKSQGLQAFNLKQSMLGWAHQGLLFEKDGVSTNKLHVYSEAWNFLPKDYVGTYD